MRHALKVDFWDIDDMANKILAVLKYRALPRDLVKESVKEAKTFSWSKAADSVLGAYRELL